MKKTTVAVIVGSCALLCLLTAASIPAQPKDTGKVKDALGRLVDKPRYGGVVRMAFQADPLYFDESFGLAYWATTLAQTHEDLLDGDWFKGPYGTGEVSWNAGAYTPGPEFMWGRLAESWELADSDTLVYHIRKGVRFHNKPPTNGREMTAEDVVFSINYVWAAEKSYHNKSFPYKDYIVSITAPDEWTVAIKSAPGKAAIVWEWTSNRLKIIPPEPVKEFGNFSDWRNNCGTGPYMLKDYVSGNSATFVRNPDYWRMDPAHPENRLPYPDGLKYLIIPDASTRLAALRTAKIDQLGAITWEDAESIFKSNPELKHVKVMPSGAPAIHMRVDKPTIALHDVRVRRALMLAIDNHAIKDSYYGGHAEILAHPITPMAEFSDIFIPPEKLPAQLRELYEYHPDKAKQLLQEAGYPDGFKTEVVCHNAQVDLLSIVKAYLEKVGVEMELSVKEYSIWSSMGTRKQHEQMYMGPGTSSTTCFRFPRLMPGVTFNYSNANDPVIKDAYNAIASAWPDEAKRRKLMKDAVPHVIGQVYMLILPAAHGYTFWQPRLRRYHGELGIGTLGSFWDWPKYVWIDEDAK